MTVKKFTVITVAAVAMITAAIVSAQYLNKKPEMNLPVTNNGESADMKPMPYIDEAKNVIMIPLRVVVEQMGGNVEWNQNYDSIVISYKSLLMEILLDGTEGTINGNEIAFDETWVNKNNHIYVTSGFISDYLNTEIALDENTNEIIIKSSDWELPIVSYNDLENKGKINNYHVNVPVITGLVDRNYEKQLNLDFNTVMLEYVSAYSTDALDGYRENPENPYRSVKWDFNCKTTYRSAEFISIVADSQKEYFDGKTSTEKYSININLQGQKFASSNDLFKNEGYLEVFGEKYDDFEFDTANVNNFYVEDGNLVLFQKDSSGKIKEYTQELFMLKNYLKQEVHYLIKNKA